MNIGAALQSMVHQQIRRFGDGLQITLRERSTLAKRSKGDPTNALTLFASALAGVSEIVAEATSLVGALPAGAKVTVGGVEYTLASAAEATVATTQLTLSLTAPLAGNLTAGATVTVSQPYADTTYCAMRARIEQKESGDGKADTARTYHLSAIAPSGALQTRRPKKGDIVIDTAGNATEALSNVDGPEPGNSVIRWTVTVGGVE